VWRVAEEHACWGRTPLPSRGLLAFGGRLVVLDGQVGRGSLLTLWGRSGRSGSGQNNRSCPEEKGLEEVSVSVGLELEAALLLVRIDY